MQKNRTKLGPPQSKLLNAVGLYANQNDLLCTQKQILSSRRHLQMILASGKLYGPMTEAQQIEAVEYAYGVKAKEIRKPVIIIGRDSDV